MEPITHLMTGACLARAGFNRKAAYTTLAMTLAAEAPDLDTFWSADGPVVGFAHHRGITHTLVGLPFDGLAVLGAVWFFHRWRLRRSRATAMEPGATAAADATCNPRVEPPLTAAPVRWGLLYGFVLIALLSHLLLDWTNNYGVRPFFPFNPRWYAGSIVFIFEPVLFAVLLIALVAPALFGLINNEVGARRQVFRGRSWAIFALASMLALWGWRAVERSAALRLAESASYGPAGSMLVDLPAGSNALAPVPILRATASPYPGNPYRWHTVVETPAYYQLAKVDTLHSTVETDAEQDLFYKPPATPATQAARLSPLGKAFLDWSSWPLVTEIGPAAQNNSLPGAPDWTAVRFLDLRFLYKTPLLDGRRNPPLTGTVYLDSDRHVVRMELGGRPQR
jgi:inner membrane protein